MKIAVMGYSGSGKSTLAKALGKKHGCEVLHLDTVQFLPNWVIRPRDEAKAQVRSFLDSHTDWVIDGNYSKWYREERVESADMVVLMLFPRFVSLWRCYRRYRKYRNTTREDMAQGCNEKLDWEFITWILWKGRTKKARQYYRELSKRQDKHIVVLKSQRDIDSFCKEMGITLLKKCVA